jgi:RNA polymerase sigma-70 factor, ECF subfamily
MGGLAPSFDYKGRDIEAGGDWSRRLHDPAIESELRSVLSAATNELPAVYRILFLLRDVEGLSKSDVAEALHLKLSAIKSRVHRTRLFLRKRLADYMGGRWAPTSWPESSR